MIIMLRQYLKETQMILNYMRTEGFTPKKYKSILELGGTPEAALSCLLKQYNPFLLSFMLNDDRLKNMGIHGAKGYISNGEIIYPEKSSFGKTLKEEVMDKRYYPTIENFDVLISTSLNDKAFAAVSLPQDKFFGFCMHKDDNNLKFQVDRCHHLLEEIKLSGQEDYEITNKETSNGNVIYLVKKR